MRCFVRYRIEVGGVIAQPERAISDQIIAIRTVVRKRPVPIRMTIEDLSDARRVLAALDISET